MKSVIGALAAGLLLVACGGAETTSTPGAGGAATSSSAPGPTSTEDPAAATTTVPVTTVEATATTTTATGDSAPDTTAPSTDPSPTASSTTPPPTAAPAPSGPVGDVAAADPSKSWWFVGSEEGDPEATSDGANCQDLYESQGLGDLTFTACGPWESFDGSYMWTVAKGATGRFQAIVWQQTADPFTWIPKMKLVEPLDDSGAVPSGWESVTMLVADVDSGPAQELLAGVELEGTGGYLFFDVIDVRSGNPQPVATVHDLDRGRALPDTGVGVAFYTPINVAGEPNCCPTTWDQFLLTVIADGWGVVDVASGVLTDDVPAGAL